jgi:hypothetical protein
MQNGLYDLNDEAALQPFSDFFGQKETLKDVA